MTNFSEFSQKRVTLQNGLTLQAYLAGEGPAVLLLHGYPQTSICWRHVAPILVNSGFTVVAADLRGYGLSDKPKSDPEHLTYSKREMAADQVELMKLLGFDRFSVVGHDRGGRVAFRAARDFPTVIQKLAVLDIAPTDDLYARTNKSFATSYYHWFFLIQPYPLPERMIGANSDFYITSTLESWSGSGLVAFSGGALDCYLESVRDPASVHAICEDYRASATIDLEHDARDSEISIEIPILALWGNKGLLGREFDVMMMWRKRGANVSGRGYECGHFLPEERPDDIAKALIEFLGSESC